MDSGARHTCGAWPVRGSSKKSNANPHQPSITSRNRHCSRCPDIFKTCVKGMVSSVNNAIELPVCNREVTRGYFPGRRQVKRQAVNEVSQASLVCDPGLSVVSHGSMVTAIAYTVPSNW